VGTAQHRHHPALVIAIDGPAASGKSAAGAAVASRLSYRFLDTGAMYRAVTWLALARGISPADTSAIGDLAERASIEVAESQGSTEPTIVRIAGEDATPHLRDEAVEANVSLVSRVPAVRSALVRIQRESAAAGRIVMAGRDIGSVVLPDADLKIYLDAGREVRARRRLAQMRAEGIEGDFELLVAELARRDGIDAGRAVSPLTAAAGAEIINTDDITLEEVVARILKLAA
jgi:cytidylate kinase